MDDRKAAIYLAAPYPNARGRKWTASFTGAGMNAVVCRGRRSAAVWTPPEGVLILDEPRLDRKVIWRPGRLARDLSRRILDAGVRPGVVLVRDTFLASVAERLADQLGVAWCLDICDNYPEVARELASVRKPWLHAVARILERVESRAVERADMVVFVTPESRDYVVEKGRRRRGATRADRLRAKSHVVQNAPWIETPPEPRPGKGGGGPCVYIGTLDAGIRDVATVVDGLMRADRHGEESAARLVLLTFHEEEAAAVMDSTGHEWRRCVEFRDPVPMEELGDELRRYSAGLVPHVRSPAVDYTISNKIFDYLYAGIPVIASDNPPNVRVLEEVGGGYIYEAEDPASFASALTRLLEGHVPDTGPLDQDALYARYTWQEQSAPAMDRLNDLAGAAS